MTPWSPLYENYKTGMIAEWSTQPFPVKPRDRMQSASPADITLVSLTLG